MDRLHSILDCWGCHCWCTSDGIFQPPDRNARHFFSCCVILQLPLAVQSHYICVQCHSVHLWWPSYYVSDCKTWLFWCQDVLNPYSHSRSFRIFCQQKVPITPKWSSSLPVISPFSRPRLWNAEAFPFGAQALQCFEMPSVHWYVGP